MDRIGKLIDEFRNIVEFDKYVEEEKKKLRELTNKQYENEKRMKLLGETLYMLYGDEITEYRKNNDEIFLGDKEILEIISKLYLQEKLDKELDNDKVETKRSKI